MGQDAHTKEGDRVNRLSSKAYRDASRGQPCTLRIAGVCTGGGEDTVFAHIRDRHTGRSIKASDISGCDACAACHARFDGRSGVLSYEDWLFYALRALQRTLEARIAAGVLGWPADPPKPARVKSGAVKATPTKIKTRKHGWPQGQRLQSRPMRRKS